MTVAGHLLQARTFASLHHRNYRLYFIGQVISVSGTWLQNVAQAWLVIELTHSPVAVGLLAVCQFGPYALLGLVGGAISDRLDKRRTLVGTQSAAMVIAGVLAVLALLHVITTWEVFALAAANGVVVVLDTPARQAFTIEMVGRRELPNAVALNSSLFNASRIIGPALGGVLIATAGVGICFAVNAASYLAVLTVLLMMREEEMYPVELAPHQRMLRGIGEGVSFAWRSRPVMLVLVMMLFVSTLAINFNVLLPVLTERTLRAGPEVFGALSAFFGGGALLGALLSASMARASWPVLVAGAGGLGVAELLLSPVRSLPLACALLFATGVCFTLYTSNSNSTIQLLTPDHLRGRVLSIYAYVFFGLAPVGGYLAGWLSQVGGTGLAFAAGGATGLVMALVGAVTVMRAGLREEHASLPATPVAAVVPDEVVGAGAD